MTTYNEIEYSHLTDRQISDIIHYCGEYDIVHSLGVCNEMMKSIAHFDSFNFSKYIRENHRDYMKYIEARCNAARELRKFSKSNITLIFPEHPVIAIDHAIYKLRYAYSQDQVIAVMSILLNREKNRPSDAFPKLWEKSIIAHLSDEPDPMELTFTF